MKWHMEQISNVLVLGGTGAIGTYAVNELASLGFMVSVTSRKSHTQEPNIEYYIGNGHDECFLESCLMKKKWTAIIDFMNYSTDEFKDRYKKLLNATSQYVFISSSRVYADYNGKLTESSPRLLDVVEDKYFLNTDDYALSKARCEDILKQSGQNNWTIIRPYMSYFKDRLDLGHYPKELWLFRILNGHRILFPKDVASRKTTLTHGADVGRGIARIVGKSEAFGHIFHITSTKSYTWGEILNVYKSSIVEHGFNFECKMIPTAENKEEFIYKYDRIYNREFCNDSIGLFMDIEVFIDAKEGINQCIREFLKQPNWKMIDWRRQANWDRILKEKTQISNIPTVKDKIYYMLFRYILPYTLLYNTWIKLKSKIK